MTTAQPPENTVIGVIVFDAAGTIRCVDDAAAELVGRQASELVGVPFAQLIPESNGMKTVQVVRRDGSTVTIGIRRTPMAGKDPVMVALLSDVAEAERRGRSDKNLSDAQRITHCGSWELDLTNLQDVSRNPLRWSDEVFRIFGYEPGAIDVTHENFFRAIHPDDRALVSAAMNDAITHDTMVSIDHRVIRPDGSVRIVHQQSEVQRDAAARPVLMIGTVQDVTELLMAAEQVRRAEQAAVVSDRMASIGVVAAGVAHELNNPLAAVMINLDVLAMRLKDGAPIQALDEARASLEQVREIVRDLRVFGRGDDSKRIAVDVVPVLESTVRMANSHIHARARLVRAFGKVPAVLATEARLAQVFLNLLVNAAQSIPEGNPGGNEIRVTTAVDARGWTRVEIADTGSGIPLELQPKIFTPFFTTKDAGTGLGLSICQRIIVGLGGELAFETAVGSGTTFRVSLPPAAQAAEPRIVPSPKPGTRGRILVVDDEPAILRALVHLLRGAHEVVAVSSPEEALAKIEAGARFDVILCDLMMPRMTGMELHDALIRIAPAQASRLVGMTGSGFTAEAREFVARQRPLLEKPFDLAQLNAVIDGVLGRREQG